jgi:hypothetical protein
MIPWPADRRDGTSGERVTEDFYEADLTQSTGIDLKRIHARTSSGSAQRARHCDLTRA